MSEMNSPIVFEDCIGIDSPHVPAPFFVYLLQSNGGIPKPLPIANTEPFSMWRKDPLRYRIPGALE